MGTRVKGKTALVTGGARGLGLAQVRLLAEHGARVILADVLDSAGVEAAGALSSEGLEVAWQHLDVTDPGDWDEAMSFVEERYGRLDVLVNNAGIDASGRGVVEEAEVDWNRTIAVNQTGVLFGMQRAIPLMRRTGGGSIVNISSMWGAVGVEESVAYQASKGAVRQMTKSAAVTYGPENIRVNSVLPGMIVTAINRDQPEMIASVVKQVPLGREADPREIAWMVLFLASDESSYVTGADFAVDGGFLAR